MRARKAPFSDIVEVNPSRTAEARGLAPSDGVSFIAMADVSESGEWTNRQAKRLGDVAAGYTAFAEGDVLFAKITPCMENGKGTHATALVNGVGFGSTEFHVLRARQGAEARFVYHWAQSRALRHAAEAAMTGSAGQQRVDAGFFSRFRIPVLERVEQRRIAEILDTLDEVIRKTEQLISKLKQAKQGLLQDLLTRGIDENGELRDPECHPERFVETTLGRLPRCWKVGPLSECLLGSPANGVYKPAGAIGRGSLLVGQTSFTDDRSVDFRLARRAVLSASELSRYALEAGDVLVSRVFATVEGVGQPALVPEPPEPAVYESNMMRLRVNRAVITPWLLFCWLRSNPLRRLIGGRVNSSNQTSINQRELNSLPIGVPAPIEQGRIADMLAAADLSINEEARSLAKCRLLKQGLMEDLLSGRVRMTDLLSEPAA